MLFIERGNIGLVHAERLEFIQLVAQQVKARVAFGVIRDKLRQLLTGITPFGRQCGHLVQCGVMAAECVEQLPLYGRPEQ